MYMVSVLLSELPTDHPRRARIMAGYQKMMATLLEYQSPEGLWRQRLDADANVQNDSVGTNVAAVEVGNNLETQYKFYQARDRKTGDLHGQGPMSWTAMALLR
jgi:hypothetical protein